MSLYVFGSLHKEQKTEQRETPSALFTVFP